MGILTLNGNRIVLNGATISLFGPDREAVAAGTLDLTPDLATAVAPASGQASGVLGLDGVGAAVAPVKAQASGVLRLDGTGAAVAPAKAQASGVLGLDGTGTITVPPLVDYSTGRLAFAAFTGRRGVILNAAKRTGTILNPTRKGRILEIA